MIKLIREIYKIIGDFQGSHLAIDFWKSDNIIEFNIYDSKIPIILNLKEKYIYIDCETSNHNLTTDMVNELYQIMKLIEDNIDLFEDIYKDE